MTSRDLTKSTNPKRDNSKVLTGPHDLLEEGEFALTIHGGLNGNETKTAPAHQITKHFAVHRRVDNASLWNVTHILTGHRWSFRKLLILKEQAIRRAKTLESCPGMDWDTDSSSLLKQRLQETGLMAVCDALVEVVTIAEYHEAEEAESKRCSCSLAKAQRAERRDNAQGQTDNLIYLMTGLLAHLLNLKLRT